MSFDVEGLRLLTQQRGPFTKSLVLLSREGQQLLPRALALAKAGAAEAEVVIHDFDAVLGPSPKVAGLTWCRAGHDERLLNVATFAVDLTRGESELIGAMSPGCRRDIRRAQAEEVRVDYYWQPPRELLTRFCEAVQTDATERHFAPPNAGAIRRMFSAGDALLVVARKDGRELNYALIYTAERCAYYMSGVTLPNATGESGKLIHWGAMQHLGEKGFDWYDLGGVPSQRPDDGIYQFKRRFGGEFVSLGVEWHHAGWLILAASKGVRRWRRWRH